MKIQSPIEHFDGLIAEWQAMPARLKFWIKIDCLCFLGLWAVVIISNPYWL